MAGGALRMAVIGALLLVCVGVAFGATTANPPPGTFSGRYKVAITVTNTKPQTTSHWIYASFPTCVSVCHAPSFHQRLTSEKSWRTTILRYPWNGGAYALSKLYPGSADCRAKSGATVKKGYDVRSTQHFRATTVTNGRVVKWAGAGKDSYKPNAAGQAHHCVAGEYDFAIKAVTQ